MRLVNLLIITVAGFPSSGKTSVIRHLAGVARGEGFRCAHAALECFPAERLPGSNEGEMPWRSWASGANCPDHALIDLYGGMASWAGEVQADLLFVESAGLCCRCSPFVEDCFGIFVADCSSGLRVPAKVGPMLTTCDLCALTRPDRVTPTERTMFTAEVKRVADIPVVAVNGLTGEGAREAWSLGRSKRAAARSRRSTLRAAPPQFFCSYCLGRTRVGILEI